ncbi:DUF1453 family protein [Paenibacillus eucommiae]|uniref:DUF1453 family protein n=1 Tax=Paenibacillus eucommiae TaxID=1355755 RepID=A0ABS4ITI3_9BACL|nr:DUF1453 family protein [Paenibacillus eucommiae]MBP1990887.1 hypothetical protein [Paenibacillus eucommiae]
MEGTYHYLFTALLIGFIVYRRTKRSIGFQKLSRRRLLFRTLFFGILGLLILALGILHPIYFVADGIGLAAGAALGFVAIRHTRFEKREQGWYYRTHLWIEVTVLVLFLGRIAYRLIFLLGSTEPGSINMADPSQFTKDPLTAGVFFVIVSYYVLYFCYLLREEVKLKANLNAV